MARLLMIFAFVLAISLSGRVIAQSSQPAALRPVQPTLPGRAWTNQELGSQGNGHWGNAVAAPAGKWIDTWKLGIAPIDGVYGGQTFTFDGTVSVQGRLNDGTWLQRLNASEPVVAYATINQTKGFEAIWGRAGGWLTNIYGAGSGNDAREYLWALNGANAGFNNTAKVVGYQLRTFSYIGDASFAFDSTI